MQSAVFTLLVCPTDSASYRLPLSVSKCITGPDFDVLLTCENGVWQPVLTARTAVKLTELRLELHLPTAMWDDALYYYNNSQYTNDVTNVRRWAENKEDWSRDLLVLKNKGSGAAFGMGLVTAHRFYSELHFGDGCVYQYTDMEGKALVPGEEYRLERFVLQNTEEDAEAFLARYAACVAQLNDARPLRTIPVGWCSWSRYYRNVNEENLCRAAASTGQHLGPRGANLLQIDDGWQQGMNFPGRYVPDETKFPHGLNATADAVRAAGMDFGLWVSPLIINANSPFYDELRPFVREDEVTLRPGDEDSHPFDFEDERYHRFLMDFFGKLTKSYGVRYYKLDFLAAGYHRFVEPYGRVYGKSDYCVALFRRVLQTIRNAVGPDVTLLACGAPMLECAGIFDAARMTCDIIWGKGRDTPTFWTVMQWVVRTVLQRGFYHNTVYINDPDGLVLRDQDVGDGFDCTWAEAKLWATAVALSGGSMLVNEELSQLSDARRSLVTALAPVLGVAAHPVDRFEHPVPTAAVTEYGNHRFVGQFYWGDAMEKEPHRFAVEAFGPKTALVIRCWDKKVLGVAETVEELYRMPHSAELYHLQPVPARPCFLYADGHVFGGVNLYKAYVENGVWVIERTGDIELEGALYGWIPAGQPVVGLPVTEVPGGTVVKIREAKNSKSLSADVLNPTGFVMSSDAQ